jgi:hypothetical protein
MIFKELEILIHVVRETNFLLPAHFIFPPTGWTVVGGYLFSFFGKEGVTGLNLYSMLVVIADSVVVLLLYNLVTGRRAV